MNKPVFRRIGKISAKIAASVLEVSASGFAAVFLHLRMALGSVFPYEQAGKARKRQRQAAAKAEPADRRGSHFSSMRKTAAGTLHRIDNGSYCFLKP